MVTRRPKGSSNSTGGQFAPNNVGSHSVPRPAQNRPTAREIREENEAKMLVVEVAYEAWQRKTVEGFAEDLIEEYNLSEISPANVWGNEKVLLVTDRGLHFGVTTSDGGNMGDYTYEEVYLDGIPIVNRNTHYDRNGRSTGPSGVEVTSVIRGATIYR